MTRERTTARTPEGREFSYCAAIGEAAKRFWRPDGLDICGYSLVSSVPITDDDFRDYCRGIVAAASDLVVDALLG